MCQSINNPENPSALSTISHRQTAPMAEGYNSSALHSRYRLQTNSAERRE